MKLRRINRRDFLKTTAAGTLLVSTPVIDGLVRGKDLKTSESQNEEGGSKAQIIEREGTLIQADMSQCKPTRNLSRNFEKNRWALIDYETSEGVKGFMASARPDETCGELTLPLNAKGVYKVFLGIHETKSHYRGSSSYGQMEVKLTDDHGFRRVGPEHGTTDEDGTTKFGDADPNIDKSITEAYWKTADLTGQDLIFRQMPYPYNRPEHGRIANLTYVKLEPLTKDEMAQWEIMKPRIDTKKLALIFCTGQYTGHTRGTYTFRPISKEFLKDEFEPIANSDFKLLIFEALRGSSCVFHTKIGSHGTKDNVWQSEWVDPLEELTNLAHNHGMKIFASMRFIGPQFPMNRSPIAWAPNYWKHPEWTMRTKEGAPITNLSLAYPEVRKYWLSLLRETLDYGTDGVQLHLNRSEPYVFYEEPVVNAFIEKYDKDPRTLSGEDPQWLEHTSGYLTQFIQEIRGLVDEKSGREFGVTLSGRKNGREVHYEENQCDVETWIREGLINYIMTTPHLHPTLLKKWRKLGGNKIHIWPDVMPRSQTAASYARNAIKYYQAGADGLCFWDGERRTARISEWAAVQRLGHKEQLNHLIEEGPSYYRAVDLKYLGGFDVKWSFKDG